MLLVVPGLPTLTVQGGAEQVRPFQVVREPEALCSLSRFMLALMTNVTLLAGGLGQRLR